MDSLALAPAPALVVPSPSPPPPPPIRYYGAPRKFIVPVKAGEQVPELTASALAAAFAVAIVGTSISGSTAPIVRLQDIAHTAPQPVHAFAVAEMLRVIRRRTSLTWDHLASIFGVSRRSLHHWANGQTVTPENQHKVRTLHERVLKFGTEPAFLARAAILLEHGIAQEAGGHARSEPILVADQAPLKSKVRVSKTPRTRIR
jgi:hypothetical protein